MSALDKYFNYFNDKLNESHKLDIINMYNNIQTYDFHDIFDTDLSFNTRSFYHNTKEYTLLNHNEKTIKATCISSNKTKIYKIYIFNNDKYKDYFLINAMREFYFQKKFREHFISNNIEDIIVPEIYRYGIINIEKNNEIICFVEMKYYDTQNTDLYKLVEQEQTDTEIVCELFTDYIKNMYVAKSVIRDVEKQLQIYHNDMPADRLNYQFLNNQCTYEEKIWFINSNKRSHNLFQSNNKFILIDFECTSIIDRANMKDDDSNKREGNQFAKKIWNIIS
jgi:hypothetical protein